LITVFFYSELHPTSMETWRLPLIPAAIGATLARNHRDIIDQELYLDPAELAHAARPQDAASVAGSLGYMEGLGRGAASGRTPAGGQRH